MNEIDSEKFRAVEIMGWENGEHPYKEIIESGFSGKKCDFRPLTCNSDCMVAWDAFLDLIESQPDKNKIYLEHFLIGVNGSNLVRIFMETRDNGRRLLMCNTMVDIAMAMKEDR